MAPPKSERQKASAAKGTVVSTSAATKESLKKSGNLNRGQHQLWRIVVLPSLAILCGIAYRVLQDRGFLGATPTRESQPSGESHTSSRVDVIDVSGPNCGASQFLSSHVIWGFHMACLQRQSHVDDGGNSAGKHNIGGERDSLSVKLFVNGRNDTIEFYTALEDDTFNAELVQRLLLDEPGPSPPNKFPWAMFSPDGTLRIHTVEEALSNRLVFIFKGGNFIWPGVEVGHTQRVHHLVTLGSIEMLTVSMEPLIFEMNNFLTDQECKHIRDKADPNMKPSPVSLMDHDQGKDDTNWRTSTTYFMASRGDPILIDVNQRVEDITRVPQSHQEQVQVLRYDITQRYTAHHDFFNPKLYQKDARTLDNIQGGKKNRLITVFWYLNDVEEGGETIFPKAGGLTGYVDPASCESGLKVKPAKGKVAMFYSMRPDGQFDDFSLHGACPVIKGQKWAANKWVWSAPVHFGG